MGTPPSTEVSAERGWISDLPSAAIRPPESLDLHEQVVYTNGQAAVFLLAAHRLVGGVPTLLVSTDARQLKQHDMPLDAPLVITGFLKMPEGDAVDAEGRRPLQGSMGLLNAFGVKRGYRYELRPEDDWDRVWAELGTPDPVLVDALEARLRTLGWADGVPPATGALSKKNVYREATSASNAWWDGWVASARLSASLAADVPHAPSRLRL